MENGKKSVMAHNLYIIGEDKKAPVLVIWEHDKNEVKKFLSKCGIEKSKIVRVNFGWAIKLEDLDQLLA